MNKEQKMVLNEFINRCLDKSWDVRIHWLTEGTWMCVTVQPFGPFEERSTMIDVQAMSTEDMTVHLGKMLK